MITKKQTCQAEGDPGFTRLLGILSIKYDGENFLICNDSDSSKESDKFLNRFQDKLISKLKFDSRFKNSIWLIFTGDNSYKISNCEIYLIRLYVWHGECQCSLFYLKEDFKLDENFEGNIPKINLIQYSDFDEYEGWIFTSKIPEFPKYEESLIVPLKVLNGRKLNFQKALYHCLQRILYLSLANQIIKIPLDKNKYFLIIDKDEFSIYEKEYSRCTGSLDHCLQYLKDNKEIVKAH